MAVNLAILGKELESMTDWRSFWDRGDAYLKSGRGMNGKREKFTTSIVYNLLSMAVEGFFMGYFMGKGGLPDNHTLRDLVDYSRHYLQLPESVATGLIRMDGIQEICSVDKFTIREPSWQEIEQFLVWTDELRSILAKGLPQPKQATSN